MDKLHFELPGYELLDKLGEGGMAAVWKARQRSLDRLVAIKILMPHWRQDADAMARFRHEALAAARLKHSGIIQVFDAGETADAVYFVMEYVAGYTIGQRIHQHGPLDEETALDITLGVAAALRYAWQTAQMIHCDIKPDNIMIDHDGTVKVADLGLARALGPTSTPGNEDYIVGTPNYLSPEQARGETDLDCGTDIYALGASLYHMVTGRLPFGDTPDMAPLDRQQTDYLLDPLDLNSKLSPALGALIERMMIKDRPLRPASWENVIRDIQEVREGYLPPGDLHPAGASTVLRSAARTANPGKHRPITTITPNNMPTVAQVPAPQFTGVRPASSAPAHAHRWNWSIEIGRVVMLAALVVASIASLYLYLNLSGKLPQHPRGESVKHEAPPKHPPMIRAPEIKVLGKPDIMGAPVRKPEAPPVTNATPAGPETKPPAPEVAAPPAVTNLTPVKLTNGNHHSALYHRAANFYNYAFDLRQTYAGRISIPIVQRIEDACRQAISDFNACPEAQTDKGKIGQLVQSCYQILADARLIARTAEPAEVTADALPPLPAMDLPPDAVIPPTSVPTNPPPASLQPIAPSQDNLAAAWKTKPKTRATVLDEFRDLFSLYPLDTREDLQNLLLYDRIAYGMAATEAARLFGLTTSVRQPLASPLFPSGYYFLYDATITSVPGFNRLFLIVDNTDHVVAVQLVSDQPAEVELRLPAALFQQHTQYYDFIRVLLKTKPDWHIAYRVALIGRLMRLDCELASDNPAAPLGLGIPRARSYLYLPQTLAAQMLERAR